MGVGLTHSTQRVGKPHTRGRGEQNVHKAGKHVPCKQRRNEHDNTTELCGHEGKTRQKGGVHFLGTSAYA